MICVSALNVVSKTICAIHELSISIIILTIGNNTPNTYQLGGIHLLNVNEYRYLTVFNTDYVDALINAYR